MNSLTGVFGNTSKNQMDKIQKQVDDPSFTRFKSMVEGAMARRPRVMEPSLDDLIYPGDERYEKAPYEVVYSIHPNFMVRRE